MSVEAVDALAHVPMLAGLERKQLQRLARDFTERVFTAGSTVIKQGDEHGIGFFVIGEGEASVEVDGEEVARLRPGEHFGEIALIDGNPRSADVVAGDGGCRTISIGRDDFLRLIEAHPRVAGQLVTFLRHALRQGSHGETEADHEDIAGRLTQAIDLLARDEGRAEPLVELLPVQLRDGAIWWFRPADATSWQRPCDAGRFPGDLLIEQLRDAGAEAEILHSTSWRYAAERLVLSYVAVLPAGAAPVGLSAEPVRRIDLARGGADAPPEAIGVAQVVEHGLRHLAWLVKDDPVVGARLGVAWASALDAYEPEPFRALVPA